MPSWSDVFQRHCDTLFSGLSKDDVLARYGWVEDYANRAAALLSPANLASMPPQDIYAALDAINVPKCQVRMTNLGRMNEAEQVLQGISALLAKPGDFAAKYRAGKVAQAGVVTLSQILCLARPDRFVIRNAPFTRALAKQAPLYSARALDELGYEEFLDMCRELTRVLAAALKPCGLGEWALSRRFLLLYAVLVE